MKKGLFLIVLNLLSISLFAQTNIKAVVVDSVTNEVIKLAQISLYKKADNTLSKSLYTDDDGFVYIKLSENPDSFYFQIEAVNYQSKTLVLSNSDIILIKLNRRQDQVLDEVRIIARKKNIFIKGDKMIFDVEQMGIGTSNNGLETIQQLPGISIDKDENIKFRGSIGIQVMINGRKSMLQGDALREFIRSIKGEDIQSIEIIAQPSARYEATGTTGILNIVFKKDTSKKIGGNVYSYGKYGEYYGYDIGSRLFFNDERWSIVLSCSYYNGESFNYRLVNQAIQLENEQRNLNQSNYWLPKTKSKSFNLGMERKLNKNHFISTDWQWNNEKENAETTGKTDYYLNGLLQDHVIFSQNKRTPIELISGNLFYNFTSDSLTTKIDTQINYGYYKKEIDGIQNSKFTNGHVNSLLGLNQTKYNMMNMQLDWKQESFDNLNFESGTKYSFVEMNYLNQYSVVEGSNSIIPDSLMVNDFSYKEKLISAYSQVGYSLKKWSLLAGLRIENYSYTSSSNIDQKTNTDNYINWFPSASISYENESNQYRLSYSKRISRPNYQSLNPYFEYLDAYSIEKGNPLLKPQLFHSFELNYIYSNSLSFGLYGYLYKDGFITVIDYSKSKNYNIMYESNASVGSRFGFSASFPYEIGEWWTIKCSLDAYQEKEKSEIPHSTYNGTGLGFEMSMYHQFTFPKSLSINWSGFLSGRNKTPTGYTPVIYDFSASIRKYFIDEKLLLVAGCTNVLKKSMSNYYSNVNNLNTHWINIWETRKFYLQITYKFGGNIDKKIKNTTLNEEQKRI